MEGPWKNAPPLVKYFILEMESSQHEKPVVTNVCEWWQQWETKKFVVNDDCPHKENIAVTVLISNLSGLSSAANNSDTGKNKDGEKPKRLDGWPD